MSLPMLLVKKYSNLGQFVKMHINQHNLGCAYNVKRFVWKYNFLMVFKT